VSARPRYSREPCGSGRPTEGSIDPPVLSPHHVPDQPGNVIGVERGLPACLRRRQAIDRALQCLEVFLRATPDSRFKCTHIRFPAKKPRVETSHAGLIFPPYLWHLTPALAACASASAVHRVRHPGLRTPSLLRKPRISISVCRAIREPPALWCLPPHIVVHTGKVHVQLRICCFLSGHKDHHSYAGLLCCQLIE
jgi:hypothetical protein